MAFSSGDFRAASGTRPSEFGVCGASEIPVPFFSRRTRSARGEDPGGRPFDGPQVEDLAPWRPFPEFLPG